METIWVDWGRGGEGLGRGKVGGVDAPLCQAPSYLISDHRELTLPP